VHLVRVACAVCGSREADTVAAGYDYEYATVPDRFEFQKCRSCGHLFLNPRPSAQDLSVIYPPTYYSFSEAQSGSSLIGYFRGLWEAQKVKSFRALLGPGKKKILDVGCGEGRFLSILKQHGDPAWELMGVDFDAKAVAECRKRGFRAEAQRIEDFKPEEKFDAIIMFQLIEHVEDPREVVRQVRARLNPGGFFIIETPNPAGRDYHWFKKSYWSHYHIPRHWNIFTPEHLRRLLVGEGFEIVEQKPLLAAASWIISLHNLFLDKGYPAWLVRFFTFRNPLLLAVFVPFDLFLSKILGFPTSNQRMTGRAGLPS
jgi:SAM-dependent methyltransferase